MASTIPSYRHDLSWLRCAFETQMPVASLCTIILPALMAGMFTMGLNPEDSALRTTYYLVITAAMPVSMLAGYVLALIPARRVVLVITDVVAGVVAFLAYLWFQARISIVVPDVTSTFIGWQWQSHYQQDVLTALVIVVSCRAGMTFPRRGGRRSRLDAPSSAIAAAFTLLMVALAYVLSWLLGTWWLLYLLIACQGLVGASMILLLPDGNATPTQHLHEDGTRRKPWKSVLLGLGLPFLMLSQGFTLGLGFVASSWTAGWLGSMGTSFLAAVLVTWVVVACEARARANIEPSWPFLAASLLLIVLVSMLAFHAFSPVGPGWSVLCGISAGLLAITVTKLATSIERPFRTTVHLLLALFCASIGFGGGIAYYLYAPYGDEIIVWIVLAAGFFSAGIILPITVVSSLCKVLVR